MSAFTAPGSKEILVFPDTRSVLFDLLDGSEHLGKRVSAFFHLPADAYSPDREFPIVHIYGSGGTIGAIDRVDRRTVDVYAPGEQAVNTLESIIAFICGTDIETPSGYVDSIQSDVAPEEIPFQSEHLNRATATLLVTSRPI